MDIITTVIGVLLIVLSIPLLLGKGEMLIAGYNTSNDEEKAKFDTKKLCRTVGVCVVCVGLLTILLEMISWKYFFAVYLLAVILVVGLTVWLANVRCKK